MTDYPSNGKGPISVGEFIMQEFIEPGHVTTPQIVEASNGYLCEDAIQDIIESNYSLSARDACILGKILGISPEMLLRFDINYNVCKEFNKNKSMYDSIKTLTLNKPKLCQECGDEHD